jgi:ACS family hexuronate transporter-like MFS transporter
MNEKKTNYRWVVVALLFFATTINYIDRQIIGLLKDYLEKDFNWSEKDYSNIVMAFTAAYAAGNVLFGYFIDRIGTKAGYSLSIIFWSVFAAVHALAKSTAGFVVARVGLGLGESGNFPTAIKSVAEWFPKKQRAFATGIFNSGTNIGAVISPFVIMWMYYHYGWQQAFIWTGVLGFVWLIFWLMFYEVPSKHKYINKAEYDYIHSDDVVDPSSTNEKVSWLKLLGYKQTWAVFTGKFFTDPIWWFYLFWIPSYFNNVYHLDLKKSWILVSSVYLVAGVGSVLGGYISGHFIGKGWTVVKARKRCMFIYALCVVPVFFIQYVSSQWMAVALISLAAAAHQAWSANIFTTASDMFPKKAVSSVVGIGNMSGAVGGILFPLLIGIILDHFKLIGKITAGYNIIFIICSCAYLFAWLMMHLLAPKMERVDI